MTHDITIKAVHTPRYNVTLLETRGGIYVVQTKSEAGVKLSSTIRDCKMACALFDLTLEELEGN